MGYGLAKERSVQPGLMQLGMLWGASLSFWLSWEDVAQFLVPFVLPDHTQLLAPRLPEHALQPNLPPEALHDPTHYRATRLYTREVEAVLQPHLPLLYAVYSLLCAKVHTKLLRLDEWLALLDMFDLTGDHTGISKREGKLIFAWSQVSRVWCGACFAVHGVWLRWGVRHQPLCTAQAKQLQTCQQASSHHPIPSSGVFHAHECARLHLDA